MMINSHQPMMKMVLLKPGDLFFEGNIGRWVHLLPNLYVTCHIKTDFMSQDIKYGVVRLSFLAHKKI